ncbi:tetratricopeptide repeat protein [Reyranella sp.]|uniref:tetratricopeptide repeat protein n=1 Tax=Reyranella sp. TaxID=1929291 RepID=UPI003BAD32D5
MSVRALRMGLVGGIRRSADRALREGRWREAARLYRMIAWIGPADAGLWVQLGHAHKEEGDLESAEAAYRRSTWLDETLADGWLHLAHLLKRRTRLDEAEACFGKAVAHGRVGDGRVSAEAIAAHAGLADLHRERKDWKRAAMEYGEVLALQPGNAAIRVQLGHALKEQGELEGAEEAYSAALQADPGSADAMVQLGHVLRRQGRRADAVASYRRALDIAPESDDAARSLLAAVGYSPLELARLGGDCAADAQGLSEEEVVAAFRHGASRLDILWFGNVEWHFRRQRPQQLALALADLDVRIVYVSMLLESSDRPAFRVIGRPHARVVEVRLGFPNGERSDLANGLSEEAVRGAAAAIATLEAGLDLSAPVVMVQEPSWEPVVRSLPRRRLVYDCVDLLAGFPDSVPARLAAERRLLELADTVVVASAPLGDALSEHRPLLLRNGVNVDDFGPPRERGAQRTVRVGYCGAVREWFAFDWLAHCARHHPDWAFEIVGRVEVPLPPDVVRPNVTFVGEVPYPELAPRVAAFDVALIPFRVDPLTRATNPVKLYEYLAAGKPVVATSLPETRVAGDLVYLAEDERSFENGIEQALREDGVVLAPRRIEWARRNTWKARAEQLLAALDQDEAAQSRP